MHVCLGILAHNEAGGIARTIESLFGQSLLMEVNGFVDRVTVHCVANGCTDGTEVQAEEVIARLGAAPSAAGRVTCHVHQLALADKSNAWNVFVHELAPADADVIGLMDADIVFGAAETLTNMVLLLNEHSEVRVATDLPQKVLPQRRGLFRRTSLASSSVGDPGSTAICGQLYLARAAALRDIWLPTGLPVEDGFIRACVVTDCFRRDQDISRVRRAPDAGHTFEGEATLRGLIRHQKRIVIGSTINSILFDYLWSKRNTPSPIALMRGELERNPSWLSDLVRTRIRNSRGSVVPSSFRHQRWKRLSEYPLAKKVRHAPVIFAGWVFDNYISRLADRSLRRGAGVGFW